MAKNNYMRCYLKPVNLFICSALFLLCSCSKSDDEVVDVCKEIQGLKAHAVNPLIKGESVEISADQGSFLLYSWTGPNNFQSYERSNFISSVDYFNEGWYYVSMSNPDCASKVDSVYVDVLFPQGTASCTPDDNTATFESALVIGDQSFYGVSFGPGAGYEVTANSSNGDMMLRFPGYWSTRELQDGVYFTTADQLPSDTQIDRVYISAVNQSIFWTGEPDKPVYISHVGGKKRITFCDIEFAGGFGGTNYTVIIDAQITED